ncbi:MAG TPA: hypothetical protein VJJ83_05480 [Candidatus Babeliales bacterium]|nr:hypothetical protein [Candidatus Babeliales bacterium]
MAKPNKTAITHRVGKLPDNALIAGIMVGVTIVLVISVLLSRQLWGDVSFNQKVTSRKSAVNKTLEQNASLLDTIKSNFEVLEKDGPQPNLVLDALPTDLAYDNIGSEFEQAAARSGARLVLIAPQLVTDPNATAAETSSVAGVQEVQFRATATGSYQALQDFLKNLELNIRPLQVNGVTVSGEGSDLSLDVTFITYFRPVASVEPQVEVLR